MTMSTHDTDRHKRPRRETAARAAFYVWIAAYAAVTIAIVTAYGLGGTPPRTADIHARQGASSEPLDPTPVGAIHSANRTEKGG
jgi:hypothetical protein